MIKVSNNHASLISFHIFSPDCCCHQMPDMDLHEAGSSIHTVLSRQDVHRSSLLWDAPLEDEVFTCPKS